MTDDEIAADAISFNVKVTDENTGRTIIVWPDAATKPPHMHWSVVFRFVIILNNFIRILHKYGYAINID
jgi:hypothetical protein